MAVSQWSDTAKALTGALFGNPEMAAKQDQVELERQKIGIQQQQYELEKALNPAKIGQAEAAAGYDNARAKSEATALLMKQLELDQKRKFLEGQTPNPAPSLPQFNPAGITPDNAMEQVDPSTFAPPINAGVVSDAAFDAYPAAPLPVGPEIPLNPMTMGAQPQAPNQFDDLIASLTGGAPATPVQVPTQPQDMADMLSPEIRSMIVGNLLPAQNVGDLILAREGFNANQGVTDPNKRILNAAAGRGTFASPDQVTAQAMGSTLPTARLSELGVQNMGTADMKDYEKTLIDPKYATFLAEQKAGQEIEFGPDGKVTRIGKGTKGGNKPLTEVEGKNLTTANALREPLAIVEKFNTEEYEPSFADYTLFTQSLDSPAGASIAIPLMSPKGQQYYGAFAPIAASIANQLSGQGMSDQEQRRRLLATIAIPGEDKTARQLKFKTMRSYFESADTIGNPGRQGTQTNTSAAVTEEDPTGLVDQPAASVQQVEMEDASGNRALVEIGPNGTQRVIRELP